MKNRVTQTGNSEVWIWIIFSIVVNPEISTNHSYNFLRHLLNHFIADPTMIA